MHSKARQQTGEKPYVKKINGLTLQNDKCGIIKSETNSVLPSSSLTFTNESDKTIKSHHIKSLCT